MINLLCISLLVCKLSSSQAAWSQSVLRTAWLYHCQVCSMVNELYESKAKSQNCPGSQICWFMLGLHKKWVLYFCISCKTKCILLFEVSVMIKGQFTDVMPSYVNVWLHSLVSPKTVLILPYLSDCCASLGESAASKTNIMLTLCLMIVCSGYCKSVKKNCCFHIHI